MNKYRLTNETIEYKGRILYRIEATEEFYIGVHNQFYVDKGDKGGFVESERNLDQSQGNAWVSNDAKVYDNAVVRENAIIFDKGEVLGDSKVYGNAVIFDNARIKDNSRVFDNATVEDEALIYGNVVIREYSIVTDQAAIRGYSDVHGDALVGGNTLLKEGIIGYRAFIKSDDDYFIAYPIGPGNGTLIAYKNQDEGVTVKKGSFTGTLQEFRDRVKRAHGNSRQADEYKGIIRAIKYKLLVKRENTEEQGEKPSEYKIQNSIDYLKANGYKVEKTNEYVVKFKPVGYEDYYYTGWMYPGVPNLDNSKFQSPFSPYGSIDKYSLSVHKFTDREKAEALATLIEGKVEEV